MAGKFGLRLPSPSVLLLSAVFIILSGSVAEGRQCYWCGPLAEQVHRSRRAPPCGAAARHVTMCEPGYDHCAIVATSPSYTESRFCVKLYQDECYPLFCNSTNSWKMTCPCRGDLCNGAPTEREDDAFAVLAKLVAKTHSRIKKRTAQLTGNPNRKIVNPAEELPLVENTVEETASQDNTKEVDPVTTNSLTSNDQTTEVTATENNQTASDNNETKLRAVPTTPMMLEIDIIQKPSNYITSESTTQDEDVQADEPVQQDRPKNDNFNAAGDVKANDKESELKDENKINDINTESTAVHTTKVSVTSNAPETTSVNTEDKTENMNVRPYEPTNIFTKVPENEFQGLNKIQTSSIGSAAVSITELPATVNTMASKITTAKPTQASKMQIKNYATKHSTHSFFGLNFYTLNVYIFKYILNMNVL